jgi:hypothetical protein
MIDVVLIRQNQGRLFVNLPELAERLKADVVGRILRRVAKGKDIRDKVFAPYSRPYGRQLNRAKEDDRVDLRLTGGLLNSLKVISVEIEPARVVIRIAPDTGGQTRVQFGKGVVKRKGRGPQTHNQVGFWLHYSPRNPKKARPWLGLSPEDKSAMRRYLWQAIKAGR